MSKLEDKVSNIVRYVNSEMEGLNNTERAMVLLLAADFLKAAVEISVVDTYKTLNRTVEE